KNTTLSYIQTKPSPTEADTTASALPFVSIENLNLDNITLHYKSIPDGLIADVHLANFLLQLPKADLAHQNIEIDKLALKNSTVKVKTREAASSQKSKLVQAPKTVEEQPFSWPDWNVQIAS